MPSVVVMNYSWEAELGEGREPPLTVDGDLCRIYEGIPFDTGEVTCTGSLYGTVTVRQASHGYDREEIDLVNVFVDDVDKTDTGSTGGYQITPVDAGSRTVKFAKTGFFDLEETGTVACGKETMVNGEMICDNTMTVTTTYTTAAGSGILPDVVVSGQTTYLNGNAVNEVLAYTVTTDNDGVKTVKVAAGQNITGTATKDGYDDAICTWGGNDVGTAICLDTTYSLTCELCTWNSVVGTVTIGGQKAAGYRVDAVRSDTWAVVDTDTTTADGVFALDNFSDAVEDGSGGVTYPYHIRLYNPNNTLISTKTNITVTLCGATGVVTYTDGTWAGATW